MAVILKCHIIYFLELQAELKKNIAYFLISCKLTGYRFIWTTLYLSRIGAVQYIVLGTLHCDAQWANILVHDCPVSTVWSPMFQCDGITNENVEVLVLWEALKQVS